MRVARLFAAAFVLACCAGGACAATSTRSAPRVALTAGAIEGFFDERASAPSGAKYDGAVFKGIPFAQPPEGELRWRPPAPVQPWNGVKQALAFAPACAQLGRDGPAGSEDCLYLNVWTPEWPIRGKHPVMMWLFGGANSVNSASTPLFDGAELASHGVVVVTINHRVGVLGFLAHPQLSAESPHASSGNYALLDQLMALRWIQENIAAFGGDPNAVTLFGQSSGSYDLLLLMTSPHAKGLFTRAIAQAGQMLSYDGSMTKRRAEALGERVAIELNAPAGKDAIRHLRSLPVEQVLAAGAKLMPTSLNTDTGLLTNVDGWVLPEPPARVFASRRQLPIPLIVGNNAREISQPLSPDEVRRQIHAKYGEFASRALQAYGLANGEEGHRDPLLGDAAAQWMTDTVQRCAVLLEAQWHAGAKHPVWQYQFERSIPGREAAGAFHGAEVAFVFGTLSSVPATTFSDSDRSASAQMQAYWTNFAKTGNPNGQGLPRWPQGGDGAYLAFTQEEPVAKPNPQREACAIFRDWTLARIADSGDDARVE